MEVLLIRIGFAFSCTTGRGSMYFRDEDSSMLVEFKYDTCRHLTESPEVPTRTKAAHVPDTGHLYEAFPSSVSAFLQEPALLSRSLSQQSQLSAGKSPRLIQFTSKRASSRNRRVPIKHGAWI